jgi:very-short-patch-repair endonuclease
MEETTLFIDAYRNRIRIIQDGKHPLFCAKDIASILGHSNLRRKISNIRDIDKTCVVCDTKGGPQKLTFISLSALKQIVCTSRKTASIDISTALGIIGHERVVSVETTTLHQIQTSFASFNTTSQYKVGQYFIDLYFEDYKIAVECDEHHHVSLRHQKEDEQRQKTIEESLGCIFIRYNPQSIGFSIFNIISKINDAIVSFIRNPPDCISTSC